MKHSTIFILLTCLSLSACQQSTESPKLIAEKYWQSLKTGDFSTAKKLVSTTTQANLDEYLALADEEKSPLTNIEFGSELATVTTLISDNPNAIETNSFETILVMENGQWKIDASRTQVPAPKKPVEPTQKPLSDSLQENLNTMDDALEEGADILNKFMHEGSKEMSDSLLKGMNKMNEALKEAVEKMKQRREQQETPESDTNYKTEEGLI